MPLIVRCVFIHLNNLQGGNLSNVKIWVTNPYINNLERGANLKGVAIFIVIIVYYITTLSITTTDNIILILITFTIYHFLSLDFILRIRAVCPIHLGCNFITALKYCLVSHFIKR